MDPVIIASARRHGVGDDDILHAYQQPVRVLELDDLVMLIGPSRIIHAMPARAKFIR